jgi:hypothetical protein
MRILKTAALLGIALAFTGAAIACDKDQTTKADQVKKQQTAATQTLKADQKQTKPGG